MTSRNEDEERVTVRLPAELPVLNRAASRILLAILVELTEIEVLDGPVEGGGRDC
jgi:hypothetical protein